MKIAWILWPNYQSSLQPFIETHTKMGKLLQLIQIWIFQPTTPDCWVSMIRYSPNSCAYISQSLGEIHFTDET